MGALDKIRVIDFGHYVAGPVTGMLLADQGADVIKIDPPGGPRFIAESNATWNRGKRAIALDLHDPADLAVAKQLVATADVVIENFRPGVMERLGLGEAQTRIINPELIYVSIPAFGPEDPRASMPGWEGVVMAALDGYRPHVDYRHLIQQLHRRPDQRDGLPAYTVEPVASMFAALLSAVGVSAALRVRDMTGRGQRVQVPLFDALVQAAGMYAVARLPFKPTWGSTVSAWNHQYRCQDGRWLHLACQDPHHAERLAEMIGHPELVSRTEDGNHPLPDEGSDTILTLERLFRSAPAEAWETRLHEAHLPGVVCRSAEEWVAHPMATQSGFLIDVDDPVLGPMTQPAPPVVLADAPATPRRPAPKPDQHRHEILAEVQEGRFLPQRERHPISAVHGPLSGIRVVDLGVGVAGPACGRTLAELGAEVIKVDEPTIRSIGHHQDLNRGKRTILLDLEDDGSYNRLMDLIATADVVIESFPPGDAEDLGLDYATLRAERPQIVYASISAYGKHGPWHDVAGSGETADAMTGMQVRFGGAGQPTVWPYGALSEYGAGYATAFGIIMALRELKWSGVGQRVDATTTGTSGFLQSAFLLDHQTKRWTEPSGPGVLGLGPIQSLYACNDGWIFLGARNPAQLAPMFNDAGPGLAARLAAWCAERSVDEAVAKLLENGLGAHRLTWLNDALSDPVVVRRGLSLIRDHGGEIGLLRTTGPAQWLSRSVVTARYPAGRVGSDTVGVLNEVNEIHAAIEAAVRKAVAALGTGTDTEPLPALRATTEPPADAGGDVPHDAAEPDPVLEPTADLDQAATPDAEVAAPSEDADAGDDRPDLDQDPTPDDEDTELRITDAEILGVDTIERIHGPDGQESRSNGDRLIDLEELEDLEGLEDLPDGQPTPG